MENKNYLTPALSYKHMINKLGAAQLLEEIAKENLSIWQKHIIEKNYQELTGRNIYDDLIN